MSLWTRTESRAREASTAHDIDAASKAAYEKGRRDERAARKRHPLIMTGLFVLAIAGASFLTLAVMKGSFSEGGAVADHQIAASVPVVQDAATQAGEAAKAAGSYLVQKSKTLATQNKS
jgi:hypothetical protein